MKLRYLPLILLGGPAAAQTTNATQDLQLWPEAQAELALQGGDYLLLALRGQRSTTIEVERTLGFDERRATLGYEHFWSEHWSGGATLRYVAFGGTHDFVWPELLLRHRSPVGPLTFGQRLSVERSIPVRADAATSVEAKGQTWVRLRLDLEKLFPVGKLTLRPRLSAEAATHLRLQKADNDPDERTIQYTSLRAEVGCRLSDHFDLTPWVAYQTSYLLTLPQFDSTGKQTAGGKLNAATPTMGLELRYTIFQGKTVFERQQLPTQH